jgi:hypothetical protein
VIELILNPLEIELVEALKKAKKAFEGIQYTDYPVSDELEAVNAALELAGVKP